MNLDPGHCAHKAPTLYGALELRECAQKERCNPSGPEGKQLIGVTQQRYLPPASQYSGHTATVDGVTCPFELL